MAHTDLQPFVDAAKDRGAGDEFLASLLKHRGWPDSEVYDALAGWWERATGVPAPARRRSAENARDAFLYLLAFSTLATWAGALGALWFRLIDYWLPDAVLGRPDLVLRQVITWQVASILIALPIYLLVMRVILRETRANPERIESGVRKWLTYIALLLAAAGVVSDLVVFLDYFLRGEITLRFVLKCATVLLLCGGIFRYYLGFLRGQSQSRLFTAVAVAGAAAACIAGLSVSGMPAAQRRIEADERRVMNLHEIAVAISGMPAPPASLPEVAQSRPGLPVRDPQTGQLYEYAVSGPNTYQLCATFASASEPASPRPFWRHPAGRSCFAFESARPVPW